MEHVPHIVVQLCFIFLGPTIKGDIVRQDRIACFTELRGYATAARIRTPGIRRCLPRFLILHICVRMNAGNRRGIGAGRARHCSIGVIGSKFIGGLAIQESAQVRDKQGVLHVRECVEG